MKPKSKRDKIEGFLGKHKSIITEQEDTLDFTEGHFSEKIISTLPEEDPNPNQDSVFPN